MHDEVPARAAADRHDDDGRLITQKETLRRDGADSLAKTTTFGYDADDNLLGWSDGRYSATLTYDDAGRLASETLNYGSFSKSRSYTYYPNNQVKTYTGPDGVTISYSYDAQGQLERLERGHDIVERRTVLRKPGYWVNGQFVHFGTEFIEIPIESWIYNLGPNKLMRRIRFEDGIVVGFDTLGYGYH